MKQPIIWTAGPLEYAGSRGNWLIAKIVCDGESFFLYDQRYCEGDGLGMLAGSGISLEEAKKRAEEFK